MLAVLFLNIARTIIANFIKNLKDMNSNRLINEKSPYLLQHAYNPVDWYPWGGEAFEKAKSENKPIFLSIGYSTCHWCHVMEHESFEDNSVAAMMNEAFVNIKVDREERPDIDQVYMAVCQMLTGSGGWPMTILMTPDKEPFFAGTYFPKKSLYGRIGMLDLVPKIKSVWENEQDKIIEAKNSIIENLNRELSESKGDINNELMNTAFKAFSQSFDSAFGGFRDKPKFPSPHNLMFLLRHWKRTGEEHALKMVEKTLLQMRLGGIWDHAGFGFHRYSTDREWLVPHFEKMLYDQAMLGIAYTEAYLSGGNILFKQTAEEIYEYLLRDMVSPEGGFYSAEDADSEGVEGKFYIWTADEIDAILGSNAGKFKKIFNVSDEGNFIEETGNGKTGNNILHLKKTLEENSFELNESLATLEKFIKDSIKKLFKFRENRVHPYKDDKILTDWNGLMIASLAISGRAYNNSQFINAAEKSYEFIVNNLVDGNSLLHRYRDGEAGIQAHLDDYAFVIWGLIELFQATQKTKYLSDAIKFTEYTTENFRDDSNGGFFFTSIKGEKLITRQKEYYDGAIPSGNSVMLSNLTRLAAITSDTKYTSYAQRLTDANSGTLAKAPFGYSHFLNGIELLINPTKEVIIAADSFGEARDLFREIDSKFEPETVLIFAGNSNKELISYLKEYNMKDNKPTAYVCKNYVCNQPVTEAGEMLKLLKT